jgi:hypothetical protein
MKSSDCLVLTVQTGVEVMRLADVEAVEMRFRWKIVGPDDRPEFAATSRSFGDCFPDIPSTFGRQGMDQWDSTD